MFATILTVSKFVRVALWRNIPGDTICAPVELFDNEELTIVTRGTFILGAFVLLEGSNDGKAYFPIRDTAGSPVFRSRIGVQRVADRPRYVRPSVIGECNSAAIDVHLIIRSGSTD